MGQAVDPNGVQPGVIENHLANGSGSRIPFKDHFYIASQLFKHLFPLTRRVQVKRHRRMSGPVTIGMNGGMCPMATPVVRGQEIVRTWPFPGLARLRH